MILIINHLGGQFALSAHTPQSAASLRSASSLRGNRCYRGRGIFLIRKSVFQKISLIFAP